MTGHDLIAVIEGYAAIFHERDLNGDIVAPGAFTVSLAAGRPVRMLYQHAADTPVGRWTALREDARGLYARGEILLSSAHGREAAALAAGGALDGLSIGYKTVRAEPGARGARRILQADLWEISLVTFPMAPAARIDRIRMAPDVRSGQEASFRQTGPHHNDPDPAFQSQSRRTFPRGRLGGRAPHIPHAASWGARLADTLRAAAQRLSTS